MNPGNPFRLCRGELRTHLRVQPLSSSHGDTPGSNISAMLAPKGPRHLRHPGDEGYRTPTIEDTQRDMRRHAAADSFFSSFPQTTRDLRDVHSSALERVHSANTTTFRVPEKNTESPAQNDGLEDSASADTSSQREDFSDTSSFHLSWKKRIHHFTWSYFTMTMATGGIANVLWTSTHPVCMWLCMLTNSSLPVPRFGYHRGYCLPV